MLPIRDLNPTRGVPYLTYALIGLNVLIFISEAGLSLVGVQGLGLAFGVVPAQLVADPLGESPTILSSMFVHASFTHLAGNMLFLYIFGDNIEDALGRWRFGAFYLLSGVAGALAQVLVNPASEVPMIGASGAIAGVLGAYLVLYPRAKVLILNTFPPLWLILGFTFFAPAWLVLGAWFLLQNLLPALGVLGGVGSSQVAFFAHLGGFVLGLLLIRPLSTQRRVEPVEAWDGWRRQPDERQPDELPSAERPPNDSAGYRELRRVAREPGPRRFDGRWGE